MKFGLVLQMELFLLQMSKTHSKYCQFLLLSKKIISSSEGDGSLVAAITHRTLVGKLIIIIKKTKQNKTLS